MTVATTAGMANQADRNFEAFQKKLPDLLAAHAGKFALMHDGEIVDFFDTVTDAVKFGHAQFGDANFSVQEVTSQNVNLGFYSYALHHAAN
jgi:hypothetical protein